MVRSVAFSPDGSLLLTGHAGGEMRVIDLESRKAIWSGVLGTDVHAARFLADGKRIVAGSASMGAKIFEIGRLDAPDVELAAADWVMDVAVSPDQRLIALAYSSGAGIYDARTGAVVCKLGKSVGNAEHESLVECIAFSPDGRLVATGSTDSTARVWDLSGNSLAVLRHEGRVNRVAFFPDSSKIVTASKDGTARIWDVAGHELSVLRAGEGLVLGVAVSPDGRRILTAHSDWTARLWPASTAEVLDRARRRISRDFSPKERSRYADLLTR